MVSKEHIKIGDWSVIITHSKQYLSLPVGPLLILNRDLLSKSKGDRIRTTEVIQCFRHYKNCYVSTARYEEMPLNICEKKAYRVWDLVTLKTLTLPLHLTVTTKII